MKYAKIVVGLTLIASITTVGCTKKMTDSEMIECKKYEDKLDDNLFVLNSFVNNMVGNSGNVNGYKAIVKDETWIDTYEENVNKISLDKLELYHNNLQKYKDVKENDFDNVKYKYLLCQRNVSYAREIISLCEDKIITPEESLKIQKLGTLSNIIANENDEDAFAHSEKLIKLQKEMDDKYGTDSNELYLLQEMINE